MASNKDKMFGCPACGYRVSSGEEACPRCGNAFNKETKFECPFCGELVERGATSCQVCHVNYVEFKEKTEARGGDDSIDSLLLEIIKLESVSVKQNEKKFSCPKCAWMIDGSEEKCPKCGEIFSDDVSFQCPICGSLVSPDSAKCPECGISFSEDEVAGAMSRQETDLSLEAIETAAAETPTPPAESSAPRVGEAEQVRGTEEVSAATEKLSSIFGKIAEAVKVESKTESPTSPRREEKPVEETAVESEPKMPEPTVELSTEDESKEVKAEPEPASAQAPPKKARTRKLKAKPQGQKPK
jgi:RNA polymerase subunit RPABC4/transcription elongation factor Spt4